MSVVRIDARIEWKTSRTKVGTWMAVCHSLGLVLESDTWNELMEDIGDALDLLFLDLMKENELEQFLRERGWTADAPWAQDEPVKFDVPFIPELAHASASAA